MHWALGDAGAALEAGKNLRADQFPAAERKARMGTDMARARWAWNRPEQTARALLDAYRAGPGEVRDRPAVRGIVDELAERHPRTTGVRELHTAVNRVRTGAAGHRARLPDVRGPSPVSRTRCSASA